MLLQALIRCESARLPGQFARKGTFEEGSAISESMAIGSRGGYAGKPLHDADCSSSIFMR